MSERRKGQSENQTAKEEELGNLFLGIMEGYTDSAIPPLAYFSTAGIQDNEEIYPNSSNRQKNGSEISRNVSERRRRDQINENFAILKSMVPSLLKTHKPCKEKIIDNTVNYIKYLQKETERLEGLKKYQSKVQKVERPILTKCTNHNSVNVTISDSVAFLVIQLPSRRGSVLDILKILEKHQAEVLEARVDVSEEKLMTFTATVSFGSVGGGSIDKMRQDILTSLDSSY